MEKQLYSLNEVIEAAGISRSYYYKLRDKGIAPNHVKVGGKLMFRASEVKKWIASLTSNEPVTDSSTKTLFDLSNALPEFNDSE